MPTIKPFRALRPKVETAEKIAALPYDVYNRKEAKKEIEGKPLSFLRVDRPETTLDDSVGLYDNEVYLRGKENLNFLKNNNYLITEDSPAFYLYELTMGDHSQTGIVATCLVDEYLDGTIKEHEDTRTDKEQDRIRHIESLGAHTGPIYLTYNNKKEIDSIVKRIKISKPLFSFKTDDDVLHQVWKVENPEDIKNLSDEMSEVENFYIADGHHRCAAAAKVAISKREEGITDNEAENFLSVIFPDNELQVLDYNRVVKDLNGLSKEEFFDKVRERFTVEESKEPVKPIDKFEYGIYLDGKWYKINFKGKVPEDCVEKLDVSVLYDHILKPILGIGNPKTDKRIDFVGGIKGLEELERKVNSGEMEIAFSLYPTSLSELMKVADEGKLMPPKSTWFEPKLRSGLFIHEFEK